ncbi:MAG: amidase [Lautropia sp.]
MLSLNLREQRRALDRREFSCEELMAATLARVDALNPIHNAIVARVDPEAAHTAARACDAALAAGPVDPSRPLFGIPQAVKDTTATKDIVTTFGSPIFKGFRPPADALVAARARAAGAIFIGKTNVPEFGLGSHSYNSVYGVTRNARDPALSAGGSSGGAAVAVATGMLAVADGSDMMGSLRNPAAFNRVIGLRPSFGLVPNQPGLEQFMHSLSTAGPLARNVEDLALLLSVQAGFEPRDPRSLDGTGERFATFAHSPSPDPADSLRTLARGGGRARIGWLGNLGGHLATEAGILEGCEAALGVFEGLGCVIEPASLGHSPESVWEVWLTLRHHQVAGAQGGNHANPAHRALMKPELQWEIERGLALSAQQVHVASVARTAFFQRWMTLFDGVDFLALPSAQVHPFPAQWHWPRAIGERQMDTYHRWMEVVIPATLAGSPAISLPVPGPACIGLQLIAAPRQDLSLLRAARAYQQATVGPGGWGGLRP